jgi:hypothetical protein
LCIISKLVKNQIYEIEIKCILTRLFKVCNFVGLVFTTSVSLGKGRGQHTLIKLLVGMGMSNGPIRAKQVNPSSSVIG